MSLERYQEFMAREGIDRGAFAPEKAFASDWINPQLSHEPSVVNPNARERLPRKRTADAAGLPDLSYLNPPTSEARSRQLKGMKRPPRRRTHV